MWCGGLGYPTVVCLGLHRLIRGTSQGVGREKSIPSTHPFSHQPCVLTDPLQFVTGHYALLCPPSLTHTRDEWGQNWTRLKPWHEQPRGSKTCSSFLHQQQPSIALRPRRGNSMSPLEDHIFTTCLHIQVPWWFQVLSLVEYYRFHFLHVSCGFILISCPYFDS